MNTAPREGADSTAHDIVLLGKIAGAHGIRGWAKVHSYTRPPQQILNYDPWLTATQPEGAPWTTRRVTEANHQARRLLAKLDHIDDRDACTALTGHAIAVRRDQLAPAAPGEYYWDDLTGLSVVNREGIPLGVVDRLLETGANDVLVVRHRGGERLLPWHPTVILNVDTAARRLRVDWEADWAADHGTTPGTTGDKRG